MGSYDGAETADLVGLFLLSKLQNLGIDPGLYRDDGLASTGKLTPRQVCKLQDRIVEIFDEYDLDITIEVNKHIVEYLDITLDLPKEEYRPYMKPNGEPVYVHSKSNHPPGIIHNIPKSINNRLSKLSANKEVFDAIKPKYQQALQNSGYDYVMEYDPSVTTASDDRRRRKRNRSRKVIYFNPPYSKTIKTNIGRAFLNIICGVTRSADFNPATGTCRVCLEEKFFIMFCPEGATLNQRSEFFTHCRHFHKFLLAPPAPKESTQTRKRKASKR